MNSIKQFFFALYIAYNKNFPLARGKVFVGNLLFMVLGFARYRQGQIQLYLNPLSLIDRKIITGEDHDPEVRQLIEGELCPGDIYVDIGANIGYFSLMAGIKPGVEVIAFEPSPRERFRLYGNVELNKLNNITVFPCALSDHRQKLSLSVAREWNPGLNSFVNDLGAECIEKITVECYGFDSLFAPELLLRMKVIKIDVEGHEMSVLKGMAASMPSLQGAKFILELNDSFLRRAGTSIDEIYAFFSSWDFIGKIGKSSTTYDETFYYHKR